MLALIANVNRDPKKRPRPFMPADFSPFEVPRPQPAAMTKESLAFLKEQFAATKLRKK